MTDAQRQTERTVRNAEDALAELLIIGTKLRLQLDILIGWADEDGADGTGDRAEAAEVIPTMAHLTASVEALTEETARLADEQQRQHQETSQRLGTLGRRGVILAMAAVLVAVLIGGTVLWIQVATLAQQQEAQRQRVQCPFFALIVGSYDPESRAAGPDRDRYEQQFGVMRGIYQDELRCPNPPTPPRVDR